MSFYLVFTYIRNKKFEDTIDIYGYNGMIFNFISFEIKDTKHDCWIRMIVAITSFCHTIETFVPNEIVDLQDTTIPQLKKTHQCQKGNVDLPYPSLPPYHVLL